jgi:hypothetical protein
MRVIPPRVVKPSIPPGLDAICMRALAHDPRDRYSRMQQMIDALVEERFANQYREGASDLASAIRECAMVSPATAQPRTQVTDRPVTIMTRSLIENTPHRRSAARISSSNISASASQPSISRSARGTPAPIAESGAHTAMHDAQQQVLSDELMRAAALLEIPPMLRADGTPMPPFRLSHAAMQGPELNSVVGGNTITGALPGIAVPDRSSMRWTIAILGIAALIGAIAAVVIQITPNESQPPSQPPAPIVAPAQPEEAIQPSAPQKEEEQKAEPIAEPVVPSGPTITEVRTEEAVEAPKASAEEAVAEDDLTEDPAEPPSRLREPGKSSVKKVANKRPVAAKKEPKSKEPPGFLRVGSSTFAWVFVAGQKRESGQMISLPPGKYDVRVKNDETKETRNFSVEIESEKVEARPVKWEDE